MINPSARLDPKLFDADIQQRPSRAGYGEGLLAAGVADRNVVALSADLTDSTYSHLFAKQFPERFIQIGVAEQNLATVASGLAHSGKIPFIASYATFAPGRCWEQIRTTICYNDANVKIAGHHTGISTGPDGATHQAIEDIATMRVLSNMRVFVPCDSEEGKKATLAAAQILGPVYLRFGREKSPVMTTGETPFVPGRAYAMWQGKKPQVLIIGCGPLLYQALLAARILEKEKIGITVLNSHTIKPLDEKTITDFAKKHSAVVSVEEHQIAGGLGGAVAELLAKKCPLPMEFVGLQDTYAESGKPAELMEKYGLTAKAVATAAKKALKRA
jgi:transketolase